MCSQMGCEREEGREGTQDSEAVRRDPWTLLGVRGPREEPDSRRSQCWSSGMKLTTQGPLACLLRCVCMTRCRAVAVCTSVILCLLTPSLRASKFMSVSVSLCVG